jgi:hypothetical protein
MFKKFLKKAKDFVKLVMRLGSIIAAMFGILVVFFLVMFYTVVFILWIIKLIGI